MGNYISKISKDCLLGLEEFMKNATSFEKGKLRPGLDRLTGGHIRESTPYRGFQKKKRLPHYRLERGGGTFFKTG